MADSIPIPVPTPESSIAVTVCIVAMLTPPRPS
jgi:hypothetical protein